MGITLGGKNARFIRVHGDIVVAYQYVNGERAMVMWPRYRQGVTGFIVCDSAAFKYTDPVYLAKQAKLCCELWGWEPAPDQWYKIAKIIDEGLADLVKLPPEPETAKPQGRSIGEASLIVGGRTLSTGEITLPTPADLDSYRRAAH